MDLKFGSQLRKAMNCEQCYEWNQGCLMIDEACNKSNCLSTLVVECFNWASMKGYTTLLGGKTVICQKGDEKLEFRYFTLSIYWFKLYDYYTTIVRDRTDKEVKEVCWKVVELLTGYFESDINGSIIPCSLPDLNDELVYKALETFK